jgi:hypothetical protein
METRTRDVLSCLGQPVMDGRQAPVSLGDSRSTFEVLLDVMREAAPVAGTGFPIDYVDVFFD